MTGSSSNNVHSKVSLKGSRMVCASINKKASRRQDHQILMFIVKYLKKAARRQDHQVIMFKIRYL